MLILALDTAWRTASAALLEDGKILGYREKDSEMNHSKTILPEAELLLAQCGRQMEQVDVFAAVAGPGSFTGVRIGTAAIKGYAWAMDKPCAGVSTLEAAAWAAREQEGLLCAAIPARADEFFYAFFENRQGLICRLTEDKVGKGLDIVEQIRQRGEIPWLTGTGAEGLLACCTGTETLAWLAQGCYQNAAAAALCAWQMARQGRLTDCHGLKPCYLRLSQAEQMRQKNKLKQKQPSEIEKSERKAWKMNIAIGSDHAGFALKQEVKKHLQEMGCKVEDFGTYDEKSCHYPIYAQKVATEVVGGRADLGVLICGTGAGMAIAANKVKGIRAVTVSDCFTAKAVRMHNDANVLCMGARVLGPSLACLIAQLFVETGFEGGRHQTRIDMIADLEKGK